MSDKSDESTTNSFWLDSAMLAILSAGAYVLAFVREVGYASVFHFPIDFVTIGLTNVLVVAAILLLLFGALTVFLDSLINFIKKRVPQEAQTSVAVLLMVILLMLPIAPYFLSLPPIARLMTGVTIAIVVVIMLIVRWAKRKKVDKSEAEPSEKIEIFEFLARRFGPRLVLTVTLLTFGAIIAYFIGSSEASTTREFLVTNTEPEMVVLRIYGDNLICASFNPQTKELGRDFKILKLGQDSDITLSRRDLGPLHAPEMTLLMSLTLPAIQIPTPTQINSTATP